MHNQRLNYVLVGVFVTTMLVAGIGAIFLLAGRTTAQDSYTVVLDNVADVKFGTQVRFEGYPIGQVEAIEPLFEATGTRFRLALTVEQGWRIPSDSVARIGTSSFLGAKTVDIAGGKAETALAPGDAIAGAASADMFAAMSSVAADIGELSRNDLGALIRRVSALVDTANRLVENDLRGVIGSVGGVATGLERQAPAITGELLAFTRQLNDTVDRMKEVLSQRNIDGAGNIIRNVELTSTRFVRLGAELETTLHRLDAIFAGLGEVMDANDEKVASAVEDARYTLRAIAKSIDSINHNMAGSARNMNEFSRLIRQNPGLLLGSSPRREVRIEAPPSQSRPQRNLGEGR